MERKQHIASLVTYFSLIILSFCVVETLCKRQQIEQLSHFYKAKLSRANSDIETDSFGFQANTGIDTDSFRTIHNINRLKILHQDGLKEKDRIEKLPRQPAVKFSQYGGYVTVDESAGRALYYYFVEGVKSKNSLPLLLWLNGGMCIFSLHILFIIWWFVCHFHFR